MKWTNELSVKRWTVPCWWHVDVKWKFFSFSVYFIEKKPHNCLWNASFENGTTHKDLDHSNKQHIQKSNHLEHIFSPDFFPPPIFSLRFLKNKLKIIRTKPQDFSYTSFKLYQGIKYNCAMCVISIVLLFQILMISTHRKTIFRIHLQNSSKTSSWNMGHP